MGNLILGGATSGQITVAPPAVAGTNTATLPAGTGTIIETVTNMAANPVTGTPSSSNFLRGDGTWASATSTGTLLRAPQILTSGTSYTTPAGCNSIYVEMLGGGGGGGGCQSGGGAGGAGGGGSGGYLTQTVTVSPSTAYTIAVGSGGNGAASGNNAGTAGGNTAITVAGTTYTAGGGGGGGGFGTVGAAGTAGTVTNGNTLSFVGSAGTAGGSSANGGNGGQPNYIYLPGNGLGYSVTGTGNGGAASFYGCGGGGGKTGGTNAQSGGAGSQGYMRISEYS